MSLPFGSLKRPPTWTPHPGVKRSKKEDTEDAKVSIKSGTTPDIQPEPLPPTANHGVERISFAPGTKVSRLPPQYLERVTQERSKVLALQGRRIVGIPLMLNDGIVLHWVHDRTKQEDDGGALPWHIHHIPPLHASKGVNGPSKADWTSEPSALQFKADGQRQPLVESNGNVLTPVSRPDRGTRVGASTSDAIMVVDSDNEEETIDGRTSASPAVMLEPPFPEEDPLPYDEGSDSDIEIVSWSLSSTRKHSLEEAGGNNAALQIQSPLAGEEQPPDSSGSSSNATSSATSRQSTFSLSRSPPRREKELASLYGDWGCLESDRDVEPSSDGEYHPPVVQPSAFTQEKGKGRVEPDNPFDLLLRHTNLPDSHGLATSRTGRARRMSLATSSVSWRESSVEDDDVSDASEDSSPPRKPVYRTGTPASQITSSRGGKNVPVTRGNREAQRRPRGSPEVIDDSMPHAAAPPTMKKVPLPKTPYGRSRRILVPASDDLPLATVTMRGDLQFIDRKEHFRISLSSLPNKGDYRHVEDACVVGDTIVLGYDGGPCQVTLLPVTRKSPRPIDVQRQPHVPSPRVSKSFKGGVSCLSAMCSEAGSIKFFSGGHDRWVYLWTAETHQLTNATCKKLSVFHDSGVSAIAYQRRSNALMSSDGQKLWTTDLSRSYTPKPVLVSNVVNQIHVHPQAPDIILLEIKHLDQQIQIFDCRKGGFNRPPCFTFGHRYADAKFEPSYTKGSTRHVYFARGHQDGSVILWDYRNPKDILIKRQYQQIDAVVHTAFSNSEVVAFGGRVGGGVVTFFSDYLEET
ncbi:hypothetical protein BV22DRAFT_1040024 [Leucogyrophana mollusca]|uniref:Uncharacterized protein n=1 Tax=Leucogyrophana mollusca TaxID=85980 RepID=A0ACB8B3G4_9AGAM|nr:hypothetical protein BV22DRAFT_1040024 [Leucogyrophana mollusca]